MDKQTTTPSLLLSPYFYGFFLLIAFETLASLSSRSIPSFAGDISPTMLRLSLSALAFLAVSVLSKRLFPLKDRHGLARLAVAGCFLGGLSVLFRSYLPAETQLIVPVIGIVLVGALLPVLKLYWLELYATLDMLHVAVTFSLSQVLSSLAIVCFSALDASALILALTALFPPLSMVAYRRALVQREKMPLIQGETVSAQWAFPFKPIVVIGLFAATNTLVRSCLPVGSRGYAALGVAAIMVPVLLVIMRRPVSFDARMLASVAFPLMAAGPLCLIMGLSDIGALCTNAAYATFTLFVVVALCATTFRYGANPLWLFGIAFGAADAGKALATAAESIAIPLFHSPGALCIMAMVIIVLFALVMAERNLDTWGVSLKREPAGTPTAATLDNLVDRCMRLARIRGLTRREEEILFLLAKGDNPTSIADQLFIAESTARVHVKHVYAKLGVHSKQELQHLVERGR